MKWYLASRTRHQKKLIKISRFLEDVGETVNSDWIYKGDMKPFLENLEMVQELAEHNTKKILDADVFIAFNDLDGTDLFSEFGVALGKKAKSNNIKIYIIGDKAKASLMQLYPGVIHVEKFSDILPKEGLTESINFDHDFS